MHVDACAMVLERDLHWEEHQGTVRHRSKQLQSPAALSEITTILKL